MVRYVSRKGSHAVGLSASLLVSAGGKASTWSPVEAPPLLAPPLAQSTMSFGFAGGVEPQPMRGCSKG